jgi:hypothetical protein
MRNWCYILNWNNIESCTLYCSNCFSSWTLSFTKISTFFIPVLKASKAAFSAAVWAAKATFELLWTLNFLLKPEIVSPVKLVIVTIVLLNVDWIWTTPLVKLFLSFFSYFLFSFVPYKISNKSKILF